MKIWVGTDVGGTFTDLWAASDDGRQAIVKSPSTADIVTGIRGALELAAAEFGLSMRDFATAIERFGHGTTAGLNALLTKTAPPIAVVTTAGFGDTLEIGRLKRQLVGLTDLEIGDYLNRGRWPVLVPRQNVFEVAERIDSVGDIVVPLSDAELDRIVERVRQSGVEAVAVATLWSVVNKIHEARIADALRAALPQIFVSESHRVASSVGEYARMSTTVVNASLAPVMSAYLARLDAALSDLGVTCPVLVMTGDGGVVGAEVVSGEPVSVLMSGPAAGVIACRDVARRLGYSNVLTVDIGGTSFDVGTIVEDEPLMRSQFSIAGADIERPALDVSTIGAGGGSIARLHDGGLIVGPASAGANPGPVCYGRGGTEPTATDADLVLGVLAEDGFAGGTMRLDRAAAAAAIDERIARPLGINVMQAAQGIRDILDNRMSDLLRSVTIERGHDPRDFVVFACGGQGPSHAWALCRELGVRRFVVTPVATGQSAYGTGTSENKRTHTRACYGRLDGQRRVVSGSLHSIAEQIDEMTASVSAALGAGEVSLTSSLALRYRGQAHHLDVHVVGDLRQPHDFAAVLDRFEHDYQDLFGAGAGFARAGFEITSARVVGSRVSGEISLGAPDAPIVPAGYRSVVFDDASNPVDCPVYRTNFPAPGQRLDGPCLVMSAGQTLVVPPGAEVRTDDGGNFIVTLPEEVFA